MSFLGITERDEVDKKVRAAGNEFYEKLVAAAPRVADVIHREAAKRGVDPRYVMYLFLTDARTRSQVAGRNADELNILHRLFIESSYRLPGREFSMPPPDQEDAVDDALAAVAEWASSDFSDVIAAAFVDVVKRYGAEVQDIYRTVFKEPVNTATARKILTHELTLRVKDHPFWFDDHSTLYKILSMMFRMPA
jgi:hypothetical protein